MKTKRNKSGSETKRIHLSLPKETIHLINKFVERYQKDENVKLSTSLAINKLVNENPSVRKHKHH